MSSYFDETEKMTKNSENSEQTETQDNISNKSLPEKIKIYYNFLKDKIHPYKKGRWIVILFLTLIYFFRVIKTNGFFALTYCIGIHFLNAFIGFISPLDDPEAEELNNTESYLPQKSNEEFRPFQRKVKEYKFWSLMFWTFIVAIPLTFFKCFDIPVFWPMLLFYFIFIFVLIMKRQIKHMIRYHYLPWDTGKKNYSQQEPPK